jgi:hypothetical protein
VDNVGVDDDWTVTFSDGSKWEVAGYIKGLGTTIPFDDKIEMTCEIRITAKPKFTAAP